MRVAPIKLPSIYSVCFVFIFVKIVFFSLYYNVRVSVFEAYDRENGA